MYHEIASYIRYALHFNPKAYKATLKGLFIIYIIKNDTRKYSAEFIHFELIYCGYIEFNTNANKQIRKRYEQYIKELHNENRLSMYSVFN